MSKGGELFHSKIRTFLPQNAMEPRAMYQQRSSQAHYHSHVGSITNLYVSWLFAADFTVKPHKRGTSETFKPDPFYGIFQEDVGDETTFSSFTRERFREALTTGKSYWLVELPSDDGEEPQDKAAYDARNLGRASLKNIDNASVRDWECDAKGRLKWVNLYTMDMPRESVADTRTTIVETWCIYDETYVTTYELAYEKGKKPGDNTEIAAKGPPLKHGFKRVPLMKLTMPEQLCIGEQTRDSQLEHFRLDNALSWLSRRTCYAQPVFKLEDGEKIPTMGAGYAIVMGIEDEFGWTSPPATPFDVLQKMVDAKRDSIYRVTHTMAQSVDNNAETVGRSADSKEIDAAATRIMLQAYATYVSKAIEETYETISEARGETEYEWSVEGFSGYDTTTVASLIASTAMARSLGIPSQSFHKALSKKVAMAMFAGEDQRMKDTICDEIDEATFDTTAVPPKDDVEKARAEALRAEAAAIPVKAEAAKTTASAAVIVAKKPTPKPTPKR